MNHQWYIFFDSKVSLKKLFPKLYQVIQIRAWPPTNVFRSNNTEVLCLFVSFTFFTLLASMKASMKATELKKTTLQCVIVKFSSGDW